MLRKNLTIYESSDIKPEFRATKQERHDKQGFLVYGPFFGIYRLLSDAFVDLEDCDSMGSLLSIRDDSGQGYCSNITFYEGLSGQALQIAEDAGWRAQEREECLDVEELNERFLIDHGSGSDVRILRSLGMIR